MLMESCLYQIRIQMKSIVQRGCSQEATMASVTDVLSVIYDRSWAAYSFVGDELLMRLLIEFQYEIKMQRLPMF